MDNLLPVILLAVCVFTIFRYGLRRITIYEYETGLKYSRGRFSEIMTSGQYWYLPGITTITKIDNRPRAVTIPGQEVLSSDSVGLKISLAVMFQVGDPTKAINKVQDYQAALYQELQVALRIVIGSKTVDELLEQREGIGTTLKEISEGKCQALGLQLQSVSIKDIMFPGPLKTIFTQVVRARKEGLAALEKARGETAALRSLANAAQMVKGNPELLQLRALHAAPSTTVVIGVASSNGVLPVSEQVSGKGGDKGQPS